MIENKPTLTGILLHISSLPSGDLGADAYRFVDFLQAHGFNVWQTLPLNMPHADGSPYQCLSAHAGNPAFISTDLLLTWLLESGVVSESALWQQSAQLSENQESKTQHLLQKALDAIQTSTEQSALVAFENYCSAQAFWLDDFALFILLRNQFEASSWADWPQAFKFRNPDVLMEIAKEHVQALQEIKFAQFVFFQQWQALKAYANQRKIQMFGDIPIFVAFDSADVWAHREQFKLDEQGHMTVVAGVPPDYFSATGQRWGNPHYSWEYMEQEGFTWWQDRIKTQHLLFDMIRVDHFRGLQAAWEIPASEQTAMHGEWQLAPGKALLTAIYKSFPDIELIAEDLGIITDEVNALREEFGLPGMKILQFAFDGSPDNPYLPEQIAHNSVVYTGTHDNDTSLGWYLALSDEQREVFHRYLGDAAPVMPDKLIQLALSVNARMVIMPMQDILKLDSLHRMNIPGTIDGNWCWRFSWNDLEKMDLTKLDYWVSKRNKLIL